MTNLAEILINMEIHARWTSVQLRLEDRNGSIAVSSAGGLWRGEGNRRFTFDTIPNQHASQRTADLTCHLPASGPRAAAMAEATHVAFPSGKEQICSNSVITKRSVLFPNF